MDEQESIWRRILRFIISIPMKIWGISRDWATKIAEAMVPDDVFGGPLLQLLTRYMIQLVMLGGLVCLIAWIFH